MTTTSATLNQRRPYCQPISTTGTSSQIRETSPSSSTTGLPVSQTCALTAVLRLIALSMNGRVTDHIRAMGRKQAPRQRRGQGDRTKARSTADSARMKPSVPQFRPLGRMTANNARPAKKNTNRIPAACCNTRNRPGCRSGSRPALKKSDKELTPRFPVMEHPSAFAWIILQSRWIIKRFDATGGSLMTGRVSLPWA